MTRLPARCGDGLEAAYDRHKDAVFRQCLRYRSDVGWAEDVTHDVFVKLLEYLPQLERPDELGGWLYRVAANACLSRLRREQSIFGRVLDALEAAPRRLAPSPEVLLAERQESCAALAALRALPAREQVIITMKVLDGKTQQEIAEVLGLSEGYVSKLVVRAWRHLHAAGWGGDHDEA